MVLTLVESLVVSTAYVCLLACYCLGDCWVLAIWVEFLSECTTAVKSEKCWVVLMAEHSAVMWSAQKRVV